MTQYNTLNIKLSNSQLNKLKLGIENGTQVTLNLPTNAVGEYNDKNNFPHKLLLTNMQVSKSRKAFRNGSSANMKFSKSQLSKMVMLGEFLGSILGPLLKTGLPLMRNVLKPLPKTVLVPLGLTAAGSTGEGTVIAGQDF